MKSGISILKHLTIFGLLLAVGMSMYSSPTLAIALLDIAVFCR